MPANHVNLPLSPVVATALAQLAKNAAEVITAADSRLEATLYFTDTLREHIDGIDGEANAFIRNWYASTAEAV